MASRKKPARATSRAAFRGTGRGQGPRVSGAVNLSPRFTLFGNVTLFRIGAGCGAGWAGRGGRGGRGKARAGRGGRSGGGLFSGLRTTVAELRGQPVSRRVKRGGVRRPNTIQEWEADRRDQQRLYAELDPDTAAGTSVDGADEAGLDIDTDNAGDLGEGGEGS